MLLGWAIRLALENVLWGEGTWLTSEVPPSFLVSLAVVILEATHPRWHSYNMEAGLLTSMRLYILNQWDFRALSVIAATVNYPEIVSLLCFMPWVLFPTLLVFSYYIHLFLFRFVQTLSLPLYSTYVFNFTLNGYF